MKEVRVTFANYANEVEKSDVPVLLDFWAEWCGPCRMLAPILEQIAEEYGDSLKVGKVNVDDEQELAMKFGIVSIPTVLLIVGGKVVAKSVGYRPKEDICEMIDENM